MILAEGGGGAKKNLWCIQLFHLMQAWFALQWHVYVLYFSQKWIYLPAKSLKVHKVKDTSVEVKLLLSKHGNQFKFSSELQIDQSVSRKKNLECVSYMINWG